MSKKQKKEKKSNKISPINLFRNHSFSILRYYLINIGLILIIPAFSLSVFYFASNSSSQYVKEVAYEEIAKDKTLSLKEKKTHSEFVTSIQFEELCKLSTKEDQEIVQRSKLEGVCEWFSRWRRGTQLAYGVLALIAIYFCILSILLAWAKRSRVSLLRAYRCGWWVTALVTVIGVAAMGTLATISFYDFTILLFNGYYPKVIFMLAFGAVLTVLATVLIIFKRVPLEFDQKDAYSISKEEWPEVWDRVLAIAKKIGVEPPTEILVGSDLNFFVTEFLVHHLGGKSQGRVLYLSFRLMKILSVEEVEAVIGHELGHFKGEDTVFTRKFYPMQVKVDKILQMCSQGLFLPIGVLVNFFSYHFDVICAKYRRLREFGADAVGALITNPNAMARSLVKIQIHCNAFSSSYEEAIRTGKTNQLPQEMKMFRAQLINPETWKLLKVSHLPHPLDSHPLTLDRLENLRCTLEELKKEIDTKRSKPAFDCWFGEEVFAINKAEKVHEEVIKDAIDLNSSVQLDSKTKRGRELIAKFWPKREWAVHTIKALLYSLADGMIVSAYTGGVIIAVLVFGTKHVVPGLILGGIVIAGVFFIHLRKFYYLKKAKLELDHEGIFLTPWDRKVLYTEIKSLSAVAKEGFCTMTIHLHVSTIDHFSFDRKKKGIIKNIDIGLSNFRGDYNAIYSMIQNYFENFRNSKK